MTKTLCPICNSDYHNIAMSLWVCNKHLNWLVTICDKCRTPCFSDCAGACPYCYGVDDLDYAYPKPTLRPV